MHVWLLELGDVEWIIGLSIIATGKHMCASERYPRRE